MEGVWGKGLLMLPLVRCTSFMKLSIFFSFAIDSFFRHPPSTSSTSCASSRNISCTSGCAARSYMHSVSRLFVV